MKLIQSHISTLEHNAGALQDDAQVTLEDVIAFCDELDITMCPYCFYKSHFVDKPMKRKREAALKEAARKFDRGSWQKEILLNSQLIQHQ